MDRAIHPAETPLFIAAALRGYRLQDTADGRLYRVVQVRESTEHVVVDNATFKDVANLCGATGSTTLRHAAERDGFTWPTSAKAFVSVIKNT